MKTDRHDRGVATPSSTDAQVWTELENAVAATCAQLFLLSDYLAREIESRPYEAAGLHALGLVDLSHLASNRLSAAFEKTHLANRVAHSRHELSEVISGQRPGDVNRAKSKLQDLNLIFHGQ